MTVTEHAFSPPEREVNAEDPCRKSNLAFCSQKHNHSINKGSGFDLFYEQDSTGSHCEVDQRYGGQEWEECWDGVFKSADPERT